MPKAFIELSEHANRVVNVVKARDGLRGKSKAIERIVEECEEKILDPAFKPEFVEDVRGVLKGPFKKGKSLDEILR
ncbi:MAG TPA: antitoxin [Candidatus Thermoplasmatota archaeon]